MEAVRQGCLGSPGFTCAPLAVSRAAEAAYQYSPASPKPSDDARRHPEEAPEAAASPAGPASCPSSSLDHCLQPNPANFAALRCSWTHPAVISLVMAQGLPGASLAAGVRGSGGAPAPPLAAPSLWNSMMPALSAAYPPASAAQLQSLSTAVGGAGGAQGRQQAQALPQPCIYVGHQDDWLELSPAMLPLWPTVPFEPYAGPKPVLYFVLCPQDLHTQAQLFIKDVGAQYELCNLGGHHPAPAPTAWLYTFDCSAGAHQGEGSAARAWARLSPEQRYLAGLRSAAESLQRELLTSPLPLRQGGSALEVNLGSSPVVYVVCPLPGLLEAALLEAAACLAPCLPLGVTCAASAASAASGSKNGRGGSSGGVAARRPGAKVAEPGAAAKLGQAADAARAPWDPATPDPGMDRYVAEAAPSPAGACPMDVDPAEAGAEEGAGGEEGPPPRQRYQGAAEGLFQRRLGDCQRVVQPDFPRGQAPPLDLTLQMVGPLCLSDLSGQAARAIAFELYLKIRRRPQDPSSALQPEAARLSPLVPFCSEPLFMLSPRSLPHPAVQHQQQHAEQQQPGVGSPQPRQLVPQASLDMPDLVTTGGSPGGSGLGADASSPAQPPRTLHCCYVLPPCLADCAVPRPLEGGGEGLVLLVPAAWTDSCGELLHCEVLEVDLQSLASSEAPARQGGQLQRSESLSVEVSPQGLACMALLRRSVELLGALRASTQPPNLLQHVAIARLGAMQRPERAAWKRILADRALLLPDVSPAHHLAVLELEATPPTRLATPSGPQGSASGARLLHQHAPHQRPLATVALLPSDDPAALVLPGEHDSLRELRLAFLRGSDGACSDGWRGVAVELYGLALLTAAHFALLWGGCTAPGGLRTPSGGSGRPLLPATAHLPIHAYLAARMLDLTRLVCRRHSADS